MELWTEILGISGFDNLAGDLKRLNVVIAMVALILVLSAIGCSPGSSEAELAYNDGMAYGELGEYVTAISNFTKTIQLDPDYAIAYHWRGAAYYEQGHPA